MTAGIEKNDDMVLVRERAWHGFGNLIPESVTPVQALELFRGNYEVQQHVIYAKINGVETIVPSHVLNTRSDDGSILGLVGAGYEVFQNLELAQMCEALAEFGDEVQVETAGTLRGGRSIWFLLKGESFSVRGKDSVTPYIAANNSHDGTSRCRFDLTSIRQVCCNTQRMIIGSENESAGDLTPASWATKHYGSLHERLEDVKQALELYGRSRSRTEDLFNSLADKEVDEQQMRKFFIEQYEESFGPIPFSPQNTRERNKLERILGKDSAYTSFTRRFDDEVDIAGPSAWNMLNAWTGTVQHDMKARGKDDEDRVAKRQVSNLFGLNSERSFAALQSVAV